MSLACPDRLIQATHQGQTVQVRLPTAATGPISLDRDLLVCTYSSLKNILALLVLLRRFERLVVLPTERSTALVAIDVSNSM